MAKNLTAEQIADKMIRKANAAGQDYKDGINAVTENPLDKAADKKDKYLQGIQQAVADGSYEAGLRNYGFANWKKRASEVGPTNYVNGMNNARAKIIAAQRPLIVHRNQVKAEVDSMPDDTFEQRLERMRANAVGMKAYKKNGVS